MESTGCQEAPRRTVRVDKPGSWDVLTVGSSVGAETCIVLVQPGKDAGEGAQAKRLDQEGNRCLVV